MEGGFVPNLITIEMNHCFCEKCKAGLNDLLEGKIEEFALCEECTVKFRKLREGGGTDE